MKIAVKTPSQGEGCGCLSSGGEGFRRQSKPNDSSKRLFT